MTSDPGDNNSAKNFNCSTSISEEIGSNVPERRIERKAGDERRLGESTPNGDLILD